MQKMMKLIVIKIKNHNTQRKLKPGAHRIVWETKKCIFHVQIQQNIC